MEVQVINHQRTATFQANLRRGMKLFQVESVATIAPIDISASKESAVAPVKTNDSSDDASNLVGHFNYWISGRKQSSIWSLEDKIKMKS